MLGGDALELEIAILQYGEVRRELAKGSSGEVQRWGRFFRPPSPLIVRANEFGLIARAIGAYSQDGAAIGKILTFLMTAGVATSTALMLWVYCPL